VLAELDKSRTSGLAAESAFWLFLSLVPIVAVGALLTSRFFQSDERAMRLLLRGLPWTTRRLIVGELRDLATWNGGALGLFAAVTFLWLASSGVHAILEAIETEAGVPRPWWRTRAIAIGACVLLSIGVSVLVAIGPGLDAAVAVLRRLGERVPAIGGVGLRVGRAAGGALWTFCLVAGLYWVAVPARARRAMPILPGAAGATVLEIALAYGYRIYLSTIDGDASYRGGLEAVAVTMTAVYLATWALLAGSVFNRWLGCRRGSLQRVARAGTCA
jgi:membrane protein